MVKKEKDAKSIRGQGQVSDLFLLWTGTGKLNQSLDTDIDVALDFV